MPGLFEPQLLSTSHCNAHGTQVLLTTGPHVQVVKYVMLLWLSVEYAAVSCLLQLWWVQYCQMDFSSLCQVLSQRLLTIFR